MVTRRDQQPKLARAQIIRLGRLLHMKYRPSEIGEIIGVSGNTIRRSYLKNGCPHERDENRRIWIVGTAFRAWAIEIMAERKKKKNPPMEPDEAWCFKCNERVNIQRPTIEPSSYHLELVQGFCGACGTKVYRARSKQTN